MIGRCTTIKTASASIAKSAEVMAERRKTTKYSTNTASGMM